MKKQIVLGVSSFVALCVVVSCGQNNDTGKRKPGDGVPTTVNTLEKDGSQVPGSGKPVPMNLDQSKSTDTTTGKVHQFDLSKMSPAKIEPSAECKPFTDLVLSQNESATLKDLVDGDEGFWILGEQKIWIEAKNDDGKGTVEKIQMLGSSGSTPAGLKSGEAAEGHGQVTCQTFKDGSLKDKDLIKLMALARVVPNSISRKDGTINFSRVDYWGLQADGARSAIKMLPAEIKNAKETDLIKKIKGNYKQTIEIKDNKQVAVVTIKSQVLVDGNRTRTVVTQAIYKAEIDSM